MILNTIDYMVSNVFRDIHSSSDEDFRVQRPISVKLNWDSAPLSDLLGRTPRSHLPRSAGIYVLYRKKTPFYVGRAGSADRPGNLRTRFKHRLRTFREFGFSAGEFGTNKCPERHVFWATVDAEKLPVRGVIRHRRNQRFVQGTRLSEVEGALTHLRDFLIGKLLIYC